MRYVFDIGGVLVRYNSEELARFISENANGDYKPETVKSLLSHDLLYQIETGRMSDLDFYNNYVCNVLPGLSFESLVNLYEQYFEVKRPGFELMLELKSLGRKVYTLSNLAEFHKTAIERKVPSFFSNFDKNFLSYKMCCHKPEPEIYQMLIDGIGEKPENLVFFDDSPQNIEGAKAAGINGILFSNDHITKIREQIRQLEQIGHIV